jgi:hypothetical protein
MPVLIVGFLLVIIAALGIALARAMRRTSSRDLPDTDVDVDAIAARVRQWLNEGGTSGRV